MTLEQLQLTVKSTEEVAGVVTGEVFREQATVTSKEIKKSVNYSSSCLSRYFHDSR